MIVCVRVCVCVYICVSFQHFLTCTRLFLIDIVGPAASPLYGPDIPYSLTLSGLPSLTISCSSRCHVVRRLSLSHSTYRYIRHISHLTFPHKNLQEILCDCVFHTDICCCVGCHEYLGSLHHCSHMGGHSSGRCSRILRSISSDLSESCPPVQSACQECERRH